MMSVGAYLKKERKIRKINLSFIARDLNISLSFLRAIEDDDFSKTPGGVYTQGFIKAYAQYLNLDSTQLVDQYKTQISLSAVPDPIELPKPIEPFYPHAKIISFFVIISISVTFYYMFIDKSNFQPEYAVTPKLSETMESEIEEYEYKIALSKIKEISNDNLVKNNLNNQVLTENKKIFINNNQIDVVASKPTKESTDNLGLIISLQALDSTWIQLRNLEDEIVYSKLMNINEVYTFSLKDNLAVTTGNAGNIIVSIGGEVKGKLGKKGEVLDSINISSDFFSN